MKPTKQIYRKNVEVDKWTNNPPRRKPFGPSGSNIIHLKRLTTLFFYREGKLAILPFFYKLIFFRFFVLLLGPSSEHQNFTEIGRAIGTLFSDQVDRQIDRQTSRHTDRWTDRQRGRFIPELNSRDFIMPFVKKSSSFLFFHQF